MKKVLFIATVTSHIIGFHIPYLKWFKEQGYEVHVASNGNKKIEYCDKHFDLPFDRFPFTNNNIRVYKALKKIIKENRYQIIHCHTPVGGVLARLAARKTRKRGTRVIYTAHGFHFYKGAPLHNWILYYPIEKTMARYTDCLITINQEDYKFAKKHLKAKQIELIHGVGMITSRVDKELTKEEKLNYKKELDVKEDEVVFSYVAELNKNKNQILLINTIKKLKEEKKNIKLLLIGEGPLYNYYEEVIKKENLQDNIILLGKRNDINEILSITDIYVASSIREGLPVNIMEAMYKGLPIIATNNRGHRELIENGKTGYLINDFKNIDMMISKIVELINDEKEVRNFGKRAKEKANKYCLKNVFKEMEKIYKNI